EGLTRRHLAHAAIIEMEHIMNTPALWVSALVIGASVAATGALAVDNITSRDTPYLAAVRAKIEAKDYKAALAELTPMLETHQHADVYSLMGFALRKIGRATCRERVR